MVKLQEEVAVSVSFLTGPAWPAFTDPESWITHRAPPSICSVASPALGRCHSEGQEFDFMSLWLLWPPLRVWASHPTSTAGLRPKQDLHSSLQRGLLVISPEPHGDRRTNASFFEGISCVFTEGSRIIHSPRLSA